MQTVTPGQPHIVGIRHHSPACARLVAERIRARRPRYVLIEGPADFNGRLDELYRPHRLPIAIYSYLSGDTAHYGSWTPFAEHSPEWQALQAGREVGATVRFIDLPAWHAAFSRLENRYADVADAEHEARADAYERALADTLAVQGRDALWDHLFEDVGDTPGALDELEARLSTYFSHLRADDPGSLGNQARERMMARWIAWAVAEADGQADDVLVVCGGYHAPALATFWRTQPAALPDTPEPGAIDGDAGAVPDERDDDAGTCDTDSTTADEAARSVRYGSYLVPYTFKRLDAFAGYASGMPSPAYYQWVWADGAEAAARRVLENVMQRLRARKLPVSTADLIAVHVRAEGLARLRGHARPLRCDWLDALAGALVKEALDAPLPWTYRGPLRAGTDPVLVEAMDALAGDAAGELAPGTPQPPLVAAVRDELAALGIVLHGTLTLDLLTDQGRARSRVLHRLALLRVPGIVRRQGAQLAMSGERDEVWQLGEPLEQQAALIEAGAWGATLSDAARARLEDELREAGGRIAPLAAGLNRAAWAGLAALSTALLDTLHDAVVREQRFESLAPALGNLHTLLRHGHLLGMNDAPVLRIVVEAGFDRALWLLEPAAALPPADLDAHVQGHVALRRIVADVLAGADDVAHTPLAIEPLRALAVWRRKAADTAAAPASRGAALGALLGLAGQAGVDDGQPVAGIDDAMALLRAMPAAALGDALGGLLALARETLASAPAFVAGMDATVRALDDADFVLALPGLRSAFAWLPPRERGQLADQVLALHDATHLSRRVLTERHADDASPEAAAHAARIEAQVLGRLRRWGLTPDPEAS
ncbi:DUF5682 family protein [Burkholderia cepacia]|uniref:DUF5682 family protein n=1 Tax=Burkholderia cepacia TaxID=292 RepID=UPI001C931F31|nr:DUF5682 family protein [Burkholderia cepacia]MBY4715181.1 DUF5682 family protein [Burkholderia cepacia]MBY4740915.1 DUF5682 family protein [Burkholderia cepacia]MBY4744054.1 DUF5682 family protein [Burkholderia cepacia]MBY4761632.1 DUF5682 family protein [Burkholderia cepacia]MBY4778980.1 DUF5682 family protein [Burkholderia cepacia]